jgi:hypothetical protein
MNAIIYPVRFHRNFERRWATRMAAELRRSRSEGTETFECERSLALPAIPAIRQQASLVNGICGLRQAM